MWRILFFSLFFLGSLTHLQAAYEPLSQTDLDAYYVQANAAIAKAEERVQALKNKVGDLSNVPMWNDKLELQHAIVQLEVKKTLFANFKGTESLRSPLVRDKLLAVLNNPSISEGDLTELQSLVLEEKAKIHQAAGSGK